ncbi:MAG TPA: hypothetical protein VH063_18080 [Gaiellaceae bacterium]|jgi:hypothetical protein|nr:hypothetical protein [Gaiellaceae bacterium]
MTTRRGRLALWGLGVVAVVLVAVELALGAVSFGAASLADPCTSKPAFSGGGVDGVLQRVALSGLNGAACKLGTSREELVLSFSPSAGKKIRWTRPTIDAALRAGLDRAATDTAGSGVMGAVLSFVLHEIVSQPVDWFLDSK